MFLFFFWWGSNIVKGSPSGSMVKNPPAMLETQETRVCSLGWEDPLEEGIATHSSILAWKIPWTWGRKELDMIEATEHGMEHCKTAPFIIITRRSQPSLAVRSHFQWYILTYVFCPIFSCLPTCFSEYFSNSLRRVHMILLTFLGVTWYWAPSLNGEDPLAEGMATHSSILAWRILWMEEPGRLQSMRSQSDMTEQLSLSLFIRYWPAIGPSCHPMAPGHPACPLGLSLPHPYFTSQAIVAHFCCLCLEWLFIQILPLLQGSAQVTFPLGVLQSLAYKWSLLIFLMNSVLPKSRALWWMLKWLFMCLSSYCFLLLCELQMQGLDHFLPFLLTQWRTGTVY